MAKMHWFFRGSLSEAARRNRCLWTFVTFCLLWLAGVSAGIPAVAEEGDRLSLPQSVVFGIRRDAQPFSYCTPAPPQGACASANCPVQVALPGCAYANGYSVQLCARVREYLSRSLSAPGFSYRIVSTNEDAEDGRFKLLRDGKISILCGATTATLERLRDYRGSLLTFVSGISAIHRSDIDISSAQQLKDLDVGVLKGTTAEQMLDRLNPSGNGGPELFTTVRLTSHDHAAPCLNIAASASAKADDSATDDAAKKLIEAAKADCSKGIDIYFADREILLWIARQGTLPANFVVSRRFFSQEPYALFTAPQEADLAYAVNSVLVDLFNNRGKFNELLGASFNQTAFSSTLENLFTVQRLLHPSPLGGQ